MTEKYNESYHYREGAPNTVAQTKQSSWFRTRCALTGLCLLLGIACQPASAEDDWSFSVTPYLWLASVDVQSSLSTSADHYETSISAAAMFSAHARYRSVGLFVDFVWLRLDTDATFPGSAFPAANLQSDFIHTTAALTYSLPLHGKFHMDLLAGARLWNVNEEIEFPSGFRASGDESWVDPVIGADLRYDISRRWFATVKGTVGGFGVASDIAYEVAAGVGYRITDWCSVTAGYRYLREEYDRNGSDFNLDAHGFLLGFGFHF